MKKIAITLLSVSAIIAGCKKENEPEPVHTCPTDPPSDKYTFKQSIGSYWIYESVNLDSNYNSLSSYSIDSVYIPRDTMINGKQYFIKESVTLSGSGMTPGMLYLAPVRDSAGYIVYVNGSYIKHDDFTNILNVYSSTIPPYTSIYRMAYKDSVVTVPAGTFSTIDYLQQITFQDPAYTGNRIKYNHTIMANGIGTVFKSMRFYMGSNQLGLRLLRYHIN
jgi:hypothetical protein